MANYSARDVRDIPRIEHQESADARRTVIVDANGNEVDAANPLPTQNATAQATLALIELVAEQIVSKLRDIVASDVGRDTAMRTRINIETGTMSAVTAIGSTTASTYNAAKMNWDLADIAFANSIRSRITTS